MRLKVPSRETVEIAVIGGLSILAFAMGVCGYARELIHALFG